MTAIQKVSYEANSSVVRPGLQNVFVYGTLKQGYYNHDRHLKACRFLGVGTIPGTLFHLGNFPALNLSEPFSDVTGEIYQCSWDDIIAMDRLEGHPNYYTRVEVKFVGYSKVWTYIMERTKLPTTNLRVIPTGQWMGHSTPTVEWGGWGKGAAIGSFQTDSSKDEIKIGEGNSFFLRRNTISDKYDLVDRSSGQILGKYSKIGAMLSPSMNKTTLPVTIENAVKQQVLRQAAHSTNTHGPVYDLRGSNSYSPPKDCMTLPIAAKILDIKVGPA